MTIQPDAFVSIIVFIALSVLKKCKKLKDTFVLPFCQSELSVEYVTLNVRVLLSR